MNRTALTEFLAANPSLIYLDEISAEHLTAFGNFLREVKRSDRTIYNKHERICGILRFCKIDYKAWQLRAPRYEKKLPDIYAQKQLERLLKACHREYNRVLISIFSKTGQRDQEVQHLTWTDVSFDEH